MPALLSSPDVVDLAAVRRREAEASAGLDALAELLAELWAEKVIQSGRLTTGEPPTQDAKKAGPPDALTSRRPLTRNVTKARAGYRDPSDAGPPDGRAT